MPSEELKPLVRQLVALFSGWEDDEFRLFYVGSLIPDLQAGRRQSTSERETKLIARIKAAADETEWASLPALVNECAKRVVEERSEESGRWRRARSGSLRKRGVDRILARANRASGIRLREQGAKEKALRLESEREEAEKASRELRSALKHSVVGADELNKEINGAGIVDYAEIKAAYIEKWTRKYLPQYRLAREQIDAIGQMPPSFLLKARAGSGKTTTVTAKARFLLEHERIPPDHLLILAFNKKAASDVGKKMRQTGSVFDFSNARTFHSLAYQLVKPGTSTDLLYDASTGSTKKQSEFVQRLIKKVLNPALLGKIYLFFRHEMKELKDIGAFLSGKDYYLYRRNEVQDTLGGQNVKSVGEKWLADFLFERGVDYLYEHIWYWDDGSGGNYRPDFSITLSGGLPDIVIEHWGIDPSDPKQKVPDHWDQTWQDYRLGIDRKREFWKRFNDKHPDHQVRFLETSIVDLRNGRVAFEERLTRILAGAGVALVRLDSDELHKRVETSRIGRFSTMCLQYIQKAKKQRLTPEKMAERIATVDHHDLKTRVFLDIANNIYMQYQKALRRQDKTDFDDLMWAAIDMVHREKGNCQIRVKDERVITMRELRWIMVDEYQDFSPLFHDLIAAIRKYNESVRLFCVGDDWQAINAFAGSDLRFFEEFDSNCGDGNAGYLQNNYRSAPELVNISNIFMKDNGKGSIATRGDLIGQLKICSTDKVWIEQRPGDEFAEDRAKDDRFCTWVEVGREKRLADPGMRIGRMLKQCHSILTNDGYESDTGFAILSRVERLGTAYPNLEAFHRKLRSTLLPDELAAFGNFDARVHCGTVHSYKGLEADVVIVLGVNCRNFPKIHPDNVLHAIFGVTAAKVLAEEERLFYVAMTRAKKYLHLLTETGEESSYLERLKSRFDKEMALRI